MQVILAISDILFSNADYDIIFSFILQVFGEIKMNFRTDLALERREYIKKKEIDGVICEQRNKAGIQITDIRVINEQGERILQKPEGRYITLETKPFSRYFSCLGEEVCVLAEEIRRLLPKEGGVLVAGLGNEKITPDALGPRCASMLLATRHISRELGEKTGLSGLRSASAIVPGVLGATGIETAEIIEAVVKKIKPSAVIAVDALASRKLSRLGATVQMADSGISPGSGVGNHRNALSRERLGVPVVAIGVPTVVDGATMAYDLLGQSGADERLFESLSFSGGENVMVTPKEIDLVIERAAQFIAVGINLALQPSLSAQDILEIVK